MLILWLLVALSATKGAQACTGIGGFSFATERPLPVDAYGVFLARGVAVEQVSGDDGEGRSTVFELNSECSGGDLTVDHECRHAFRPEGGWEAGAEWTVVVQKSEYGNIYESTHELRVARDGHAVHAVDGQPGLTVHTPYRWQSGGNNCEYAWNVDYEVTLTRASRDPDGLSWFRLTRDDGLVRHFDVPVDDDAVRVEFTGPDYDDLAHASDCFTLVQIDGAGSESAPTEEVCPEPGPAIGPGCACGGSAGPPGLSSLLLASAVARRAPGRGRPRR